MIRQIIEKEVEMTFKHKKMDTSTLTIKAKKFYQFPFNIGKVDHFS